MNDHEDGERFAAIREAWRTLSSEQQFGIIIFTVFGVLTLLFSGWYLRAQIRAPFLTSRRSLEVSRKYLDAQNKATRVEEEQKTKDTDGDGISDWDELNVYHTSPYLVDSDSDGILDGVEAAQGTDPNCPKDRDCQLRLDVTGDRGTTSSAQALLGTGAPIRPEVASSTFPSANMTPPEIRRFILSNHLATEAEVNALSDQSLVILYQRALRGTEPALNTSPAPTTNAVPSSP